MERALVTFEDVAIYFTRREWETLNEEQKSLYKEVMNDNYQMILSLNRPDIILNIDLGCEPYVQGYTDGDRTGSWQGKIREDGSSSQPCCTDSLNSRYEPQVKRQRRYPRVNPFRWIKKDKKNKKRFSRSSHRLSRRAEDKKTLSGDYEDKTSPERRHADFPTCILQDSANKIQDEQLPDEPFMNRLGSKDLNSEEGSDNRTSAECSHRQGEAVGTYEKQEEVLERSSLTSGERVTADTKNCKKRTEGSGLSSNLVCLHREDDIGPGLDGDTADSKDIPISETSDILMEANISTKSPSKMGTPITATQKEERRSSTTKKKVSNHKKDRHVKFSDVVTMILIEQKSEEQFSESLDDDVKVQSTCLSMLNKVNEDSKKKAEKCVTIHNMEEDRTSQGQGEGTKQTRKRTTISSCQAEVESCHPDTTNCNKKRIVKGMGMTQRAPELEACSLTKKNVRGRHELHSVKMNEFRNHPNMKSEDKVDKGLGPSQPNTLLSNHEQKFIKSYSCSSCGKIAPWSKPSDHQNESVERSIAHLCRMCALKTSSSSAITPAQTICSLTLPTTSRSGEMSQQGNRSEKITAASSAQPDTERILLAEKKQIRHKDGKKEKATEKLGNLVSANDQKPGANSDHCKNSLQTSQVNNKSKVCSKCQNLEAMLEPKLKTFTASSASNTSADTSFPSKDSSWSRIGTPDKKPASKSSVEQSKKTGDSREHEICAKCGKCLTEQRNDRSSTEQQKKSTKSSPSLLQKTQEQPHAVLNTSSSHKNMKNSKCIPNNHESTKSDKDCNKCGKSLAMHLVVNPESPGEGGEDCVLHLKKRKQPLEGIEPFQCKQCGKIFTCHLTLLQHRTVHAGERPYSCKECGKSFPDCEYLKVHMRLHTKEKLKAFTETSANKASTADTLSLGLDSIWSRIGTKDKKVAFKSSVEVHRNTGHSRERIVTEQKNDPLSSAQQKKPPNSNPSRLQKTHENIRNPRQVMDPENPKTKCGKSLAKRMNFESAGEGGKKTCPLHLKKKRKRPLEGMEPFQCKQCGKTFTRHATLLQHRTIHTGERPHSCKECGKSFRDGGYLKVHMRLHTKEKPYTCSECGKCFGQNSALVVHLRTHTDERPFQCSVCGKSFSDRSTLRHHQMIHTGEKPFTCSFCGKKFTQQAHVKRHEKMHTGERPFGCTKCEKRFVDRTKLKKHELTHNRVKV